MHEICDPRYGVTYLTEDGTVEWDEELDWMPPAIGNGVVDEHGKRWRIVDVWVVHEKHGRFEYGVYAFVEPATGDSDRLRRIAPGYYQPNDPS